MNEAAQKSPGCQHDGPCPKLATVREPEPGDPFAANHEVVRLGFDHRKIRDGRDRLLHGAGIKLPVCLRAGSTHCRTLTAADDAGPNARGGRPAPPEAAQRTNFSPPRAPGPAPRPGA